MSMINVTKKYVDILVNGGQVASFDQYDTNGDYDISVSVDDDANKNQVADTSFNEDLDYVEFLGTISSQSVLSVRAEQYASADSSNGFDVQYSTNGGSSWSTWLSVNASEFSSDVERDVRVFGSGTEFRVRGTADVIAGEVLLNAYSSYWSDDTGNLFPSGIPSVDNVSQTTSN